MKTAEHGALSFANQMRAHFIGCSSQDSEPDGYVTCNVQEEGKTGVTPLSCGYKSEGCKLKKLPGTVELASIGRAS